MDKQKVKEFFLKPNGDFKFWVLMILYLWFVLMVVWLVIEIVG